MEAIYIVILAGGKGERLWPLSRIKRPKQFVPLGNTNDTLLAWTINRVQALALPHKTWIVTNQTHYEMVHDEVQVHPVDAIITEPVARNTAPAALLALLKIYEQNPQAVVCFLPADHFIDDSTCFVQSLTQCVSIAQVEPKIVLMGLKPTYASSAYGYIQVHEASGNHNGFNVKKFHEKPTKQAAEYYVECADMFWNIGIAIASVSVLLQEYKEYMPAMYRAMHAYMIGQEAYETLENISLDYAILEKSRNAFLVPVTFGWSDVGNLVTFISNLKDAQQKVVAIDSHDSLVYAPKKLVALMGLDNLCVIDTDDVLLIMDKNKTEQVRDIVHMLKQKNLQQFI